MSPVLFSYIGMTDPIKSYHDGPLIHIVRNYSPEKVYAFFSKTTGDTERSHKVYSKAVELVNPNCKVIPIFSEIEDVSDFDVFTAPVLTTLRQIEKENPDSEIIINITSGTAQMLSTVCMLVTNLNMKFRLVQVKTPEKAANLDTHNFFKPEIHKIEEYYYEENLDATGESISRCYEPKILTYKTTFVKSQICSFLSEYDYSGALNYLNANSNLYENEKFETIKSLIEHGKFRINYECKAAETIAQNLGLKKELYPMEDAKAKQITEYFLIMIINQKKNDLSSMILKLSPIADEIAKYILVDSFGMNLKDIAIEKYGVYKFDQERSEKNLPGITDFLNEKYIEFGYGVFIWNNPLNFASMISYIEYLQTNKKPINHHEVYPELKKWQKIFKLRNAAAHSLTEVTDKSIYSVYGASSKKLCSRIEFVIRDAFKTKFKEEILKIYDTLNEMIENEL